MKIIEKINQAIQEANKAEQEKRGKRAYLYASDIFQCQRRILLEFNGMKQEFDAKTLRIFDNGNSVHERIVKYLKDAGYEVEDEQDIPKNEHNIHGRFDAKIKEDGVPKLVEIKSISIDKQYKASFVRDMLPKTEHKAQLLIYMKYTGINEGYIIYEVKNDQDLLIYPMTFNEEEWKKAEEWITEANKYLKDNIIPPINKKYGRGEYPCFWKTGGCSFHKYCWGSADVKPED